MTPTSSAGPIRVGLLGYGLAGSAFHAPLIAATPGMDLAAVVTGNAERAQQARDRYPGALIVPSAERLWERADDLDLVVLATPNRTHVPLTLAAFDAGLGVVVDKPLTPTVDDGRHLIAEAERRNLLLTVFHNRRWDGDFLTLQRLLREGALGDVQRFESRFEKWRPVPKPGWRQQAAPEEAGGLLFDLGAHLIDQALVLFGPVRDVYAELDARRGDVDDDVFVALTHTSGVRSHLWMSAVAADLGPRMRALGSRAAYTKYDLDVQEDRLRAGATPDEPGFSDEPEEQWGYIRSGDEAESVATEPGDYLAFYAGVRDALRTGSPLPVDPEDAVRGLAVIEAARRSSETRSVVTL
ncbi:MAG: Gfo/Idh/MocA family oxidoreductase [Rhodothermales bacterium]